MRKDTEYKCKCDGCGDVIVGPKAYTILVHKKSGQTKKGYCSRACRENSRPTKKRIINCAQCGRKFEIYDRNIRNRNFCSHSCSAFFINEDSRKYKKVKTEEGIIIKIEKQPIEKQHCNNCGKLLKYAKHGYCKLCGREKYKIEYLKRWKERKETGHDSFYKITDIVRTYLLEKCGSECSECGWDKINPKSKKCPLHIDHIDGDHKNSHESNLRVLCPNCHALTETYGPLNNGRGREHKKEYNRRYKAIRARLIAEGLM